MLRNTVRRGAAVVVCTALLGGGVIFGGGAASAQESSGSTSDFANGIMRGESLIDLISILLGIPVDGCVTQGMNVLC